jgi:flagellar hook-basal body complex protein FliE
MPAPIDPNMAGPAAPRPGSQKPGGASGTSSAGEGGFREALSSYLEDVNELQQEADQALVGLSTGKVDSLHEVVAAMGEADLSFRLMMEIRNKLLDAYKEITRMRV